MKRIYAFLTCLIFVSFVIVGCNKADKNKAANENATVAEVEKSVDEIKEEPDVETKMEENSDTIVATDCELESHYEVITRGKVLPSVIYNLGEAAYVPEGAEASMTEKSNYIPETLYGSWVKVSDADSSGTMKLKASGEEITVKTLPNAISFGNLDLSYVSTDDPWTYDFGLSKAITYAGLHWGCASNEYIMDESSVEPFSVDITMYANDTRAYSKGFGFCYDFSGDKIVIGYLDNNSGKFSMQMNTDVYVTEKEYKVSWEGVYLTLTDGEESVTYVPERFASLGIDFSSANRYGDNIEGLYGVDFHNGKNMSYIDAYGEIHDLPQCDITEDGGISLTLDVGTHIDAEYIYSDTAITIINDDEKTIFFANPGPIEGFEVQPYIPIQEKGWGVSAVNINGKEVGIYNNSIEQFISRSGVKSDADLGQIIKSTYVTDEIILSSDDNIKLYVRAVNPYGKDVTLSECDICYVRIDDQTGVVNLPINRKNTKQIVVNETKYSELIEELGRPYSEGTTEATFKGVPTLRFDFSYGKVLDAGFPDLRIKMKGDTISEMIIEYPSYLYCGIQDNADPEELKTAESNCFEMTVQVQKDILGSLREKFDEAGLQVTINELTGVVTLENSILFDNDSFELSTDGKRYIDDLMSVYISTLLSDEFANYIDKIVIEGHTDSTGDFEYNKTLSENRAKAVLKYTSAEIVSGLDKTIKQRFDDKAEAIGRSSTQLIMNCEGEEDRDASRRVTIKFWIDLSKTIG